MPNQLGRDHDVSDETLADEKRRYVKLNREYRDAADLYAHTPTDENYRRLNETHARRTRLAARVDVEYRHTGLKACATPDCPNLVEEYYPDPAECGECRRG